MSTPINFSVGKANGTTEGLQVWARSSNHTLVKPTGLGWMVQSATERTLIIFPEPGQFGITTITVLLSDSATAVSVNFMLTVIKPNQAPIFTLGPNVTVRQNALSQSFPNWTSGISPGAESESAQALYFTVTNDLSGIYSTQPAIDPYGTLSFTPSPGRRGMATVTVQLHDNGGTELGGQDTSATQEFKITIGMATDSDGDGLPDDYEDIYGLLAHDSSDKYIDADGDGYFNIDEFKTGTDPRNSSDCLRAIVSVNIDGQEIVAFPSVPGKRYRLERNDDFPTGPWNVVQDNITGTGDSVQITDSDSLDLPKGIYRVIVLP